MQETVALLFCFIRALVNAHSPRFVRALSDSIRSTRLPRARVTSVVVHLAGNMRHSYLQCRQLLPEDKVQNELEAHDSDLVGRLDSRGHRLRAVGRCTFLIC